MITYMLIGAAALVGIVLYLKSSNNGNKTFKNVSVEELGNLIKDKKSVLIDVRTKREIEQGKIANSLEIELGPRMQNQLKSLEKSKKYVLYCRSGKRSVMASKMMNKLGFEDVNNLLGGYQAWKASN